MQWVLRFFSNKKNNINSIIRRLIFQIQEKDLFFKVLSVRIYHHDRAWVFAAERFDFQIKYRAVFNLSLTASLIVPQSQTFPISFQKRKEAFLVREGSQLKKLKHIFGHLVVKGLLLENGQKLKKKAPFQTSLKNFLIISVVFIFYLITRTICFYVKNGK